MTRFSASSKLFLEFLDVLKSLKSLLSDFFGTELVLLTLGFVAEDVAKVLPELAVTMTENGKEVVRNVDYEKLTVLLVSEVQSLRKEVNELKINNL